MASGDKLSTAKATSVAGYGAGFKLLDAAAALGDGQWVDVRTLRPGSVEIFGAFVGTVQLRGSNSDGQPAANYEGAQIGSNITSPSLVSVGMPVRWIKAIVTAYTSGSISAFFHSTT